MLGDQCVVLVKRQEYCSHWMYVRVVEHGGEVEGGVFAGVGRCVRAVGGMLRRNEYQYSVLFVFGEGADTLEISKCREFGAVLEASVTLGK